MNGNTSIGFSRRARASGLPHERAPETSDTMRRPERAVASAVLLNLELERALEPVLGVVDLELEDVDVDQALLDRLREVRGTC